MGSTMTARTRLARRDWVEAGYQELARAGERGVAINALAARLGVTKGSFYWHFKDRGELLRALLDRWAHERTDEVLGLALGSTDDPRERLRRIQALGREIAPIDRAMRLWAQHDPAAEEAVRHADRGLLGHIAACLEDLGFGAEDARLRALLMLRSWVGGYLIPSGGASEGTDPGDRMMEILLGR
ncbi:TetR/AcrR family transcriptional regulator [Actinomadura napierensis]|uniref:TetR/AcrR family transcriptional regulator n=1 Tax=Actinomadura napierensis TaxID=267854 RepID=UPI0031E45B91